MTYSVVRLASDRWQLCSPYGDNMAVFKTRRSAVTHARALAGWRGRVVVSGRVR